MDERDWIDDEDELDELATSEEQEEGERRSYAPSPILDGSQAVNHDGYDVQEFNDALRQYARLGELVEQAGKTVVTAPALIADLFWSFLKRAPQLEPVVPLTPAYQLNGRIVGQVMSTSEWTQIREAGTIGDAFNAAIATIGAATKALAALDAATIAQLNHLHEMESGAGTLFSQAEALESAAEQASGDRAARLFEQAEEARREAQRKEAEAQATQAQLEEQAEEIEDRARRASRAGMAQAEAEIDQAAEAIKSFGGGYGPGLGLENGPLTTKEKIALATTVGKSRRLQQIAALCGRFTRVALKVQESRVQHPPDEVTSITFGRDLGRVLPSELALLADPALEELFFKRYAEGQLMQYELIGREKQGQGPIIVALDSSGSMGEGLAGMTKEVWSKAVTLALMAIARLQSRDLIVLHFSSRGQLARYEFPKGRGAYSDVIACVDHFYGGGTDFEPWMYEALALVDSARYDRADVIAITDGLTTIDRQAQAAWQERRQQRGMRAYGVLVGTRQGEGVLASITDALMTLDNLQEDMPVLETIFSV